MFSIKLMRDLYLISSFFLLSLAQKCTTIASLAITGNTSISNEGQAKMLHTSSDLSDNYFTTYSLEQLLS